jgi:hypothetical protein
MHRSLFNIESGIASSNRDQAATGEDTVVYNGRKETIRNSSAVDLGAMLVGVEIFPCILREDKYPRTSRLSSGSERRSCTLCLLEQ